MGTDPTHRKDSLRKRFYASHLLDLHKPIMYISNEGKDGMGLRPVCNVILVSRTEIVRQVSGIGITAYYKTHRGYEKTSVLEIQTFNYNSKPPVHPPPPTDNTNYARKYLRRTHSCYIMLCFRLVSVFFITV